MDSPISGRRELKDVCFSSWRRLHLPGCTRKAASQNRSLHVLPTCQLHMVVFPFSPGSILGHRSIQVLQPPVGYARRPGSFLGMCPVQSLLSFTPQCLKPNEHLCERKGLVVDYLVIKGTNLSCFLVDLKTQPSPLLGTLCTPPPPNPYL